MINKKATKTSVRAAPAERAKDKALKYPVARMKQQEIKDQSAAHSEEDGGSEDRLRAILRSGGVPASLLKPVSAGIAKLIDLAVNNRSGLHSSLSYINHQPSCALPVEPPEYFRNRPIDPETGKRETIVKFLERVWYTPWIAERLLTRTELRRLDLPAATALNNFLHAPKERWEPKNELPPHLVVPTKSEVNDTLLEDADKVREARRIVDARWRRQRGLVRGKK